MDGQSNDLVYTFSTLGEAHTYVARWCDDHGYEYNTLASLRDVGGIGHDWRLTITEAR